MKPSLTKAYRSGKCLVCQTGSASSGMTKLTFINVLCVHAQLNVVTAHWACVQWKVFEAANFNDKFNKNLKEINTTVGA